MATLDDVCRNLFELTNETKRTNDLLKQLIEAVSPSTQVSKPPAGR